MWKGGEGWVLGNKELVGTGKLWVGGLVRYFTVG